MVIELRLADARTLEQAQQVAADYLPRFNAQFAVAAAQPGTAYRPLSEPSQVEAIFCFKYLRTVGADNVVNFAGQRLQIVAEKPRRSYAQARVEVHERLDGSLAVYYAGTCLSTTPAPAEAPLLRARKGPRGSPLAQTRDRVQTDAIEQRKGREGHLNSAQTRDHIQTDKITGH